MTLSAVRSSLIIALVVLSAGCVSTSLVSDVDPDTNLSSLESFVVLKFPEDDRGIEDLIAAELNARGKTAVTLDSRPDQIEEDAVITYEDRWMWDITMYMLELNVQIRDPATDYLLATGTTYRTSLARRPPEEMVEEVIGEIFNE